MKFNELPMADVLELQTLDHARQAIADSIQYAKEQGKFYYETDRAIPPVCRQELGQKGYYVEYNMPYGFRVHWNAEHIKTLKENKEQIRAYQEQKQKPLLTMDLEAKPKGPENVIIPSLSSKFMRLFK